MFWVRNKKKGFKICTLIRRPHLSLSCGDPISMVGMPSLADIIGPIVEPQGESFLTTKS